MDKILVLSVIFTIHYLSLPLLIPDLIDLIFEHPFYIEFLTVSSLSSSYVYVYIVSTPTQPHVYPTFLSPMVDLTRTSNPTQHTPPRHRLYSDLLNSQFPKPQLPPGTLPSSLRIWLHGPVGIQTLKFNPLSNYCYLKFFFYYIDTIQKKCFCPILVLTLSLRRLLSTSLLSEE